MSDNMADRRGSERFPLVLLAEVTEISSDKRFSARTSDVSRTGCFVDTLQRIPKGAAVYVRLTQQGVTLNLKGTIAYASSGFGLGVHFDDAIEPEHRAILERWLEAAARQPA